MLWGVNSFPVPVTINPPTATLPAGEAGTDTLLIVLANSNSTIEGMLEPTTPERRNCFYSECAIVFCD